MIYLSNDWTKTAAYAASLAYEERMRRQEAARALGAFEEDANAVREAVRQGIGADEAIEQVQTMAVPEQPVTETQTADAPLTQMEVNRDQTLLGAIGGQALEGVRDVQQLGQTLSGWTERMTPGLASGRKKRREMFSVFQEMADDKAALDAVKVHPPESLLHGLAGGVARMGVHIAASLPVAPPVTTLAGGAARAAAVKAGAQPAGKLVAGAGIVAAEEARFGLAAVAMDPYAARAATALNAVPWIEPFIPDALAAHGPDEDGEVSGRLKNVAEGGIIGLLFAGGAAGVRGLVSALRRTRKANPEELLDDAPEMRNTAEEQAADEAIDLDRMMNDEVQAEHVALRLHAEPTHLRQAAEERLAAQYPNDPEFVTRVVARAADIDEAVTRHAQEVAETGRDAVAEQWQAQRISVEAALADRTAAIATRQVDESLPDVDKAAARGAVQREEAAIDRVADLDPSDPLIAPRPPGVDGPRAQAYTMRLEIQDREDVVQAAAQAGEAVNDAVVADFRTLDDAWERWAVAPADPARQADALVSLMKLRTTMEESRIYTRQEADYGALGRVPAEGAPTPRVDAESPQEAVQGVVAPLPANKARAADDVVRQVRAEQAGARPAMAPRDAAEGPVVGGTVGQQAKAVAAKVDAVEAVADADPDVQRAVANAVDDALVQVEGGRTVDEATVVAATTRNLTPAQADAVGAAVARAVTDARPDPVGRSPQETALRAAEMATKGGTSDYELVRRMLADQPDLQRVLAAVSDVDPEVGAAMARRVKAMNGASPESLVAVKKAADIRAIAAELGVTITRKQSLRMLAAHGRQVGIATEAYLKAGRQVPEAFSVEDARYNARQAGKEAFDTAPREAPPLAVRDTVAPRAVTPESVPLAKTPGEQAKAERAAAAKVLARNEALTPKVERAVPQGVVSDTVVAVKRAC